MAAKPDPHTEERRAKFISFCSANGWFDESGTWATSTIGKYFGRQPNQINNYLYGHGSFGPSVARSMAVHAGLSANFFEPGAEKLTKDAYDLGLTLDMIPEEDKERRTRAFADALRVLLKHVRKDGATPPEDTP